MKAIDGGRRQHDRLMGVPECPQALLRALFECAAGAGDIEAAAELARGWGFAAQVLSGAGERDARGAARDHARMMRQLLAHPGRDARPRVLLNAQAAAPQAWSDEASVDATYLLALALELDGLAGCWAMAGSAGARADDAAGAMLWPDSIRRAALWGLDPRALLGTGAADTLFARLGDVVEIGPLAGAPMLFHALLVMQSALRSAARAGHAVHTSFANAHLANGS